MNILDKVNWVIFDSGITSYEISKKTGILDGNILRLRNKKRKIEKISISTAARLEKIYDEYHKEN